MFTSIFILAIGLKEKFFIYLGNFIDSEKITGLFLEIERLNFDQISLLDLISRVLYFWATLVFFISR